MQHYPQFPERDILCLDGAWDFHWAGGDANWAALDPHGMEYETLAAVPGVFDGEITYTGQRGVGLYRRSFPIDTLKEAHTLQIGGLGLAGKIWMNGKLINECLLPYSGLKIRLPQNCLVVGDNELIIAIDNRFDHDPASLFKPYYDFYAYGGIYRSVFLMQSSALCINRVQVTPLNLDKGIVRLIVLLEGPVPKRVNLSVSFDGGKAQNLDAAVADGTVTLEMQVPDFRIWSPEKPNLHTIEVGIGSDTIRERFGLRTIETKNGHILLNGKPIVLKGVNRHEAHPQAGPVQSTQLMLNDLHLLKSMNCNFIRCVHYPQDQRFLDLCDEFGFLVWEESLGWGNDLAQLTDSGFMERQEAQARLMVRNSFNHPSVIIWGFLNEAESQHIEARPLYETLTTTLRKEDGSRLISYASNRLFKDVCLDLVDVISMNMYPGWIDTEDWYHKATDKVEEFVKEVIAFYQEGDFADKPFMVSEIGACALPGAHDTNAAQWTEEFQSEYVRQAITAVLGNNRVSGLALWQMFDTRSFGPYGAVRCKPLGINFAGLLDSHRNPKLSSKTVTKLYGSLR